MKLERVLPFARTLLKKAVQENDIAVDATAGNGHDTLFLAEIVGESGHVYSFDIQAEAIANTAARLKEHHLDSRATLVQKSHAELKNNLPPSTYGKITGAIFNLGYLPGGNKKIVTKPDSTITAIEQLLDLMAPEGIIVLVIYHGHPEGELERDCLLEYMSEIDQQKAHILQYQFINQQNNPPFVIAIEKRAK